MDRSSCFVGHHTWIIASLLILSAVHGAAAQSLDSVVDPKTYSSQSRRFELAVDPGDNGWSSAKYRLSENGKGRWSKTLPFTLCHAAVTDDGAAIGYGYTQCPPGWSRNTFPPDDSGEFVVVILGPNGQVRLTDSVKLKDFYLPGQSVPIPVGLVVDEANDRMFVRVRTGGKLDHEEWWVYRLSTATAVGKQELTNLWKDPQVHRYTSAIKPIRGTPLTLVHFGRHLSRTPRGRFGATFALLDLQGRLVWSLELPADYMTCDEETGENLSKLLHEGRGIVRCDQPREFELFFAAASQRVSFSVTQSASGDWTVKETARTSQTLLPAPKPTLMTLRKEPLRPLKPLKLSTPRSGPRSPQIDQLGTVSAIAIDPKGQIYAIDGSTGAMHVFDPAGRFLHVCPATPKDFSGFVSNPAISFGDHGDVYLGPGDGIEGFSRRCPYVHFGANGERLESVVWIGFTSFLQPRTNRLIELSFDRAALNELSGELIRDLVRLPDGHVLSGVLSASLAADGSFAIRAHQYKDGGESVNVFTPNGDPVSRIPLPGLIGAIEMAYDGRRIVVASEQGLFFFDRAGTALYRCDNPLPGRRDSASCPYLLDEGRTVAVFDGNKPVLYRYMVP